MSNHIPTSVHPGNERWVDRIREQARRAGILRGLKTVRGDIKLNKKELEHTWLQCGMSNYLTKTSYLTIMVVPGVPRRRTPRG